MEIKPEYFVNIDKKSINEKQSFFAENSNGDLTLLIKNINETDNPTTFFTDNICLKTSVLIYLEKEYVGNYHIIICSSKENSVINDFKEVFEKLIIKESKAMTRDEVLELFNSVDKIFTTTVKPDNISLQIGLFGELITLKYLYNQGVTNIVDFWHSDFSLKHDMELDKHTRIEIKSTIKEERIHKFKHNQLTRKDVKVYIISVLLERTEIGLCLNNLIDQIQTLTNNKDIIISLQTLKKQCGLDDENEGMIFNEEYAYNNIKLYDSADIPQIKENIPETITDISYNVDLTNIESVELGFIFNFFRSSNLENTNSPK